MSCLRARSETTQRKPGCNQRCKNLQPTQTARKKTGRIASGTIAIRPNQNKPNPTQPSQNKRTRATGGTKLGQIGTLKMDFERSTQAQSWLFDEDTLWQCREEAARPLNDDSNSNNNDDIIDEGAAAGSKGTKTATVSRRVRKFASGFHRQNSGFDTASSSSSSTTTTNTITRSNTTEGSPVPSKSQQDADTLLKTCWDRHSSSLRLLDAREQDTLVRFHAHQITMLIGPHAILPGLVRSHSVLSTAIMYFRRFYLSNSMMDFAPRRMAVAAAFLASKVEESRVEVSQTERLN